MSLTCFAWAARRGGNRQNPSNTIFPPRLAALDARVRARIEMLRVDGAEVLGESRADDAGVDQRGDFGEEPAPRDHVWCFEKASA